MVARDNSRQPPPTFPPINLLPGGEGVSEPCHHSDLAGRRRLLLWQGHQGHRLPSEAAREGRRCVARAGSCALPSPRDQATIAGSVSLALHTRTVAPLYKVPVVIHSDHCAKKLLPWFDGMLEADANYARANGGVRVPHPPISLAP